MPAVAISLIVAQIALIIAAFVFILQHARYIRHRGSDVPYVPTPEKYYPQIVDALNIAHGDVAYDLGCGDGSFLIFAARRFPTTRFVGIEYDYFLYLQARWKQWRAGNPRNLSFRRENFYTTDLKDATRIYAYLLPSVMERLFSDTTRRNLRIVSRAFPIKGRTPVETIALAGSPGFHGENRLYVYEF